MLTPNQKQRYLRHILLPEIGYEGQAALCAATFERDGTYAGGVAARYLVRAGLVGSDTLTDQTGDPADAIRGAFDAVEAVKIALGVGTAAEFPEDIFE